MLTRQERIEIKARNQGKNPRRIAPNNSKREGGEGGYQSSMHVCVCVVACNMQTCAVKKMLKTLCEANKKCFPFKIQCF